MTSHAHLVWPRRNVARQSGGRRRIAPARRVSERAAARPMAHGGLDVSAGGILVAARSGPRLTTSAELANPAHRAAMAVDLRQRYEQGASTRRPAPDTGDAYGTVHTLLREAGAVQRTPGRPTEQP